MKKKISQVLLALCVLSLLSISCEKIIPFNGNHSNQKSNGNGFGNVSPDMVLRWNDAASYVVVRTLQLQAAPRIPPFRESHYYAMVNIAVHDALNNIIPKFSTYASVSYTHL